MLEIVLLEYLGPLAAMLVVTSVLVQLLPLRFNERISDIALGAFLGVVLLGLLLTVLLFIAR